ncbi:MAG: hypothetical protein PHT57_14310 [Rhodoferax sp.]|nr:hypothetical protein [Rhodoferax sp.]
MGSEKSSCTFFAFLGLRRLSDFVSPASATGVGGTNALGTAWVGHLAAVGAALLATGGVIFFATGRTTFLAAVLVATASTGAETDAFCSVLDM